MTLIIDASLKIGLANVLSSYPVKLAYLFGSAAAGRTTPLSDTDIALVVDPETELASRRLDLELTIESKISDACGVSNADVRIINSAPLMVRGEVITNGRLLFSRDESFRVDFETRTRSEYFDFLPIARAMQTAYLKRLRERGLNGQSYKTRRHVPQS